ncbi:hypothetical protein Lgra_1620 [Legionella gratiana]|uniref:Uncharacterized protein n=1 Tax=Legionella gratiana TaxID=45066 RepID=A0A378J8C9_9GAMM|nr:hypothetical protein [Legionella gratiana]KTD10654.1 hypothetical protein Lgra_1620 [Legionella gratiana]STX43626.1 Uncharacterised protein [Legionella gratiana]
MKGKSFIGLMVSALSLTTAAHADFTFYSSTNDCKNVSGNWKGAGTATHNRWIKCHYEGSGTISELDSAGNFTLEVEARKLSGSTFCPSYTKHALTGVCTNGQVTVKTEYGNLTGNFSTNSGSSNGTLTVLPGIDVDVEILFQRVAK